MSGTTSDGTLIPVNTQPFVAQLNLSSFSELVQNKINTAQQVCPDFTDFSDGSPSLAIFQAGSYSELYLQWLVYVVFLNSRLFTAQGPGVDTWMSDFGLTRVAATPSSGYVVFGRYSATNQMTIPVGAKVQTSDGTQRFQVIADPTNSLYDITTSSFIAPVGTLQMSLQVQSINTGTQANVAAGAITRLFSTTAGVNFVTNPVKFDNGVDGEATPSFKQRFVPFINSRSSATASAIVNAINNVNPNLTFQILENCNGVWPYVTNDPNSGLPRVQFGFFTVYIDSGTQKASDTNTVLQVSQSINSVRGLTIDYWVTIPLIVQVDIEYLLTYESGYSIPTVQAIVANEVINYVNRLAVGETLNYFRLANIIDNTLGVANISFLVVAGQEGNVGCAPGSILKMGTLAYK